MTGTPADIGHDVTIDIVADDDGPLGLDYTHPTPDGGRCAGFVYFDLPHVRQRFAPQDTQMWQLEQTNPLTMTPSLLCRICGHHGFIRDGTWIPA